MKVEGVTTEALKDIADELGVRLVVQKQKYPDEVRALMRPEIGSSRLRARSNGGAMKNSLCLHGQYMFMAHVFARFPHAILHTWVNKWNYQLFQDGAKNWTRNQIRDRERYDTCYCNSEEKESAMLSPDELRANLTEVNENAKVQV